MDRCNDFGTFPLVLNSGPMSLGWMAYEEAARRFAQTGNAPEADMGAYFDHLLDVMQVQYYFDVDQKYSAGK